MLRAGVVTPSESSTCACETHEILGRSQSPTVGRMNLLATWGIPDEAAEASPLAASAAALRLSWQAFVVCVKSKEQSISSAGVAPACTLLVVQP